MSTPTGPRPRCHCTHVLLADTLPDGKRLRRAHPELRAARIVSRWQNPAALAGMRVGTIHLATGHGEPDGQLAAVLDVLRRAQAGSRCRGGIRHRGDEQHIGERAGED